MHSVKNRRNRVERVGCLVEKAAHTCSKTEWSLNAAGVPGCRVKSSAGIRSLSLSLSFFLDEERVGRLVFCLFGKLSQQLETNDPPSFLSSLRLPFFFSSLFFFSLPQILFPCYLSWRIRKFEWPFNVTNTRVCSKRKRVMFEDCTRG